MKSNIVKKITQSGLIISLMLIASLVLAPIASASSINPTPQGLVTTNGDILSQEILYLGQSYLAIGGNFTTVYSNGAAYPAKNFAVINTANGTIAYAGNVNSYVRSIGAVNGAVYFVGDFTSVSGQARNRAAALNVNGWALTNWKPNMGTATKGYALAYDSSRIYIGTSAFVKSVNQTSGGTNWVKYPSGGPVRTLLAAPNGQLYAGGLFETLAGVTQHGLVALSTTTGAPNTNFKIALRADSNQGATGGYDGEEVLSLAWDAAHGTRLVMGTGGAQANYIRTVNPDTGSGAGMEFTHQALEGDGQAVAVLGNTYFTGYHRNHGRMHNALDTPYFAALWSADTGALLPWDSGISGLRVNTNADGGNGGVQSVVFDRTTNKLYVAGGFSAPYTSLAVLQVNL